MSDENPEGEKYQPTPEETQGTEGEYRNEVGKVPEDIPRIVESILSKENPPSAEEMARYFAGEGDPSSTTCFLESTKLEPQQKREILAQAYDTLAARRDSFAKEHSDNLSVADYYSQEADHWRRKARILRGEENE